MGIQRKGLVQVRCLGVGEDHCFMSIDPKRNRVCGKCSAVLAARQHSPQYCVVVKELDENKRRNQY